MSARPNLTGRLFYDFVYWSSFTVFGFGFSYRRCGWKNIPTDGPALLVANHQSMFDPVLVGLASRRYLSYLARKNLFVEQVRREAITNPMVQPPLAKPRAQGSRHGYAGALDPLFHCRHGCVEWRG